MNCADKKTILQCWKLNAEIFLKDDLSDWNGTQCLLKICQYIIYNFAEHTKAIRKSHLPLQVFRKASE